MNKFLLLLSLILLPLLTVSQHMERLDKTKPIICYAKHVNEGTRIPARKSATHGRTEASSFSVTYIGFTPEAEAAFQAAVDIWDGLITSPVTIHIEATWQSLETGVLGSAIWGTAYRNFDGAQVLDTWYPVAMAEKMAGKDLNDPANPDIVANFNNNTNWYLGTDGNPGASQFDLVSVVLHEIGHGLGFVDSFDFNEGTGTFGLSDPPIPMIYDHYVENGAEQVLIEDFTNSSEDLGSQLTGSNLFFDAPTATTNHGTRAQLFAPDPWNAGSSIAHLDENTFPAGDANSLMSPQIGQNEVMHDPGPITLDMFGDMGWEYTYINHDKHPNTEDFSAGSYTITSQITSDTDFDAASLKLHYSQDSFATETIVDMVATGNVDEFSADIPSNNTPSQTYSYFITVNDIKGRTFTKPGGAPERFYSFSTDVDTEAPVITHSPPSYIRLSETEVVLEAIVTDYLPLQEVRVDYAINDQATQSADMILENTVDSLYQLVIDITPFNLAEGDSLKYSITAVDAAASNNTATSPASGQHKLEVVGLAPAVDKYFNDFNTTSDDFFNSANFSITTPAGFDNAAIHSDHPYQDGTGANDESNYLMELKVPIILATEDAIMSFDEVVLVEPGEAGTAFGDDQFWDYVIVEGSKDGGSTWQPFDPGYDSRGDDEWLTTYNNEIVDNNSEAQGTQELYANHQIDMLANGNFAAGDEVLIRFRLFADQAAHGWGWAIDNLQIQFDSIPPVIRHRHLDYVVSNAEIELEATITDNRAVDSIAFVTEINGEPQELIAFEPNDTHVYKPIINISGMNVGDTLSYRIVAFDNNSPESNVAYLPSEDTFFKVPFIAFGDPVSIYSNDFNSNTSDFVGNFFSVTTASNFTNRAIHSAHPYPEGFGNDGTSNLSFTLKNPVTISAEKPLLTFDEVALVEPGSGAFGSADFKDYVTVEASKDGGNTWQPLLDGYNAGAEKRASWLDAYNSDSDGSEELYVNRIIDMTASDNFSAGDEVLIRFTLSTNSTVTAWGWAIDNLEIQSDKITGLETPLSAALMSVFPNPNRSDILNLKINAKEVVKDLQIRIINMNGQVMQEKSFKNAASIIEESLTIRNLPSGVYAIHAIIDGRVITQKLMRRR